MAFLKVHTTPAGVPAVYEPRLAGLGDVGQDTTVDDVLNALPDIIKSGGAATSTILHAINPITPAAPSSLPTGIMEGGGGLLLLAAGGLALFMLMGKKRR